MFNGYEMNFLKNNIIYRLNDIKLIESNNKYLIKTINGSDMDNLKEILFKINPLLNISYNRVFMNTNNIKFLDQYGLASIFQSNKNWNIQITIQGYKSSPDNENIEPICQINEAKMCVQEKRREGMTNAIRTQKCRINQKFMKHLKNGSIEISKKVCKTNAERQRLYKTKQKALQPPKPIPKTNAERQRLYKTKQKTLQPLKPIPKTNAERQRLYKTKQKALQPPKPIPKTNAERQRLYKTKQKALQPAKLIPKTNAEHQRMYRERQKLLRNIEVQK